MSRTSHPVVPLTPDAELLAVQREAYRVEAALIGSDAIPPLRDTLATLRAAGLTWFGTRDADGLLGAVGVAPDGHDIERLVVAPRAFRRGIGTALVQHVLSLATAPVTVSTGRENGPARALYLGCGFVEIGETDVEPGLWITRYEHRVAVSVGPLASVILVVGRRTAARQALSWSAHMPGATGSR